MGIVSCDCPFYGKYWFYAEVRGINFKNGETQKNQYILKFLSYYTIYWLNAAIIHVA